MKTTSALCLLALAASILARPKYEPPSSQQGGGSYASSTYAPAHSKGPTGTSDNYPAATSIQSSDGSGSGSGSASPTGGSTSSSGNTTSSGGISLPTGYESLNGIGIGWLPDADKGVSLTAITSALGNVKPCFAGYYAQITSSSSFDGSQILGKVNEVKAGGAPYPIFVASVMPSIPFSQVPGVAADVAAVMEKITSQGLTVWLRFAHEMNWYVTDGTYHGTASEFQTAWTAVSNAVKGNPNVKMYWSPNQASAASIKSAGWYPTAGAVDVVGIDIYPKGQQTFANTYSDFCKTFGNVPFAIGETAIGGSAADKTYWLQQLSGAAAKTACPNYVGWSWFEYDKEADFRVATNGNTEAKSVLGGGS